MNESETTVFVKKAPEFIGSTIYGKRTDPPRPPMHLNP